jgi:hypothetical protein
MYRVANPAWRNIATVGSNPTPTASQPRSGVRAAEGAALEMPYTTSGIVGSNPTPTVLH